MNSERPWLAHYPAGVAAEVDMHEFASINDVFNSAVQQYRNKPAFTNMGKSITYGELDTLSLQFANYLLGELKLKKGDRIAVMMPNCLQYPVAIFGILRAGLVVVNVNPLYTARELKQQLEDAQVTMLVVLDNFGVVAQEVLAAMPQVRALTTGLGDLLGFPKSAIVNFVLKYIKKMVPDYHIRGAVRFKNALALGSKHTLPDINCSADDLAFLQYTGGTTGVSKGAMLTHRNMVANMQQAAAWIGTNAKAGDELIVTALPLYHIFALTANCMVFMKFGANNLLITNPRDMPGFIKEIKNTGFTAITGVNTLFNGLLNTPGFNEVDFSRLHLTLGGGMAVQRAVAEKWKQVTGVTLAEAYGLTETSPAVCINPLDLSDYNGSIGMPVPSTEVCIKDESGHILPAGEIGELCVKGPQVMKGYWRRPDETTKVIDADGWLHTGDVARMDEQGYFYIVDRKKDTILVSGFNVYPNEIEDVIAMMPGVLEVAAIGVPDEKSGEAVKVFIVSKDPSLSKEQIKAFCREHMTGYKQPKHIEFRSELPKSNVGKILRKELRDEGAKAS
jgi:long-chain acyl-CoA synthetase